ncbi:MAG TPA: nucleotidyl transferase AbiEii/AbiGii toxin family protein [Amycolatopsis sp.]|nr:nucleotidyl transferase AbiEii/AbiGii toxin family protein [Amycolatopsis sp.]
MKRDHLISHILGALATMDLPIVFFGGTALARTWFPDPANGGRLSEDIDLYTPARRTTAEALQGLPRLLRREFPGSRWDPAPAEVRAIDPARIVTRDGLDVRVQVLSTAEHRELHGWPTERRSLSMRYADAPPAALEVPTRASFAAMKTVAWLDRAAARDLYDLAALAKAGCLNAEAARLVREVAGWTVARHGFTRLPPFDWTVQLGHQAGNLPPAQQCLRLVRAAYASALGWDDEADDNA